MSEQILIAVITWCIVGAITYKFLNDFVDPEHISRDMCFWVTMLCGPVVWVQIIRKVSKMRFPDEL